jgi:hypothetical protein
MWQDSLNGAPPIARPSHTKNHVNSKNRGHQPCPKILVFERSKITESSNQGAHYRDPKSPPLVSSNPRPCITFRDMLRFAANGCCSPPPPPAQLSSHRVPTCLLTAIDRSIDSHLSSISGLPCHDKAVC